MSRFQGPMQPFPGLAQWARQVWLPRQNINLHLYDTGGETDPPALLLHGLGDEADTWRHVLPRITYDSRAIAPDLPGFGRSDKTSLKYTIPFFVETMLELLDNLSIPRVVLAGHSMGAVIAHAFALEYPQRVERLVLISGSLVSIQQRIEPRLLLFLTPGLGELSYNRLRKDPQAAYRTLELYYNRMEDLPQSDRDFLFQRVNERVWSDGQRRAFFSALRSLARWVPAQQKNLPARLANWTVPTSVIWGENDRVNPVESAHAMVKMLPAAQLVIVPGAGHNVHQEKAEIVADVLRFEGQAKYRSEA